MNGIGRRFLPDRFRPRATRRRHRRRFIVPVLVVTALLVTLPEWSVRSVRVRGAEVVPAAVAQSLVGLEGHLVPLLDLEWLHGVAAVWPAAAEVRVDLELPGTVVVEIFAETAQGSVAVGRGWHGIAADGRMAGAIDAPVTPRLVGFRRPADRRVAFAVAQRLEHCSGAEVTAVEMVTPDDYLVKLRFGGDGRATVHVTPAGADAERVWCELVHDQSAVIEWADLRWANRMVIREAA